MGIFFLGIFWVGTLALFNVMVGVVIERVLLSAESDATYVAKIAEQRKKEIFLQLKSFFISSDVNENGMLSMEEVEAALNTPEMYNKLKMIGFPVDDPAYMFHALDIGEDSQISIEEFFEGCERAHGPLPSKDLLVAQVALERLSHHYDDFEAEFNQFQKKVDYIASMSTSLTEHGEHIFLTMQEYRSRHPGFQHTTRPRLSMAKLDKAPWELGQKKHARFSQGSWFEEDEGLFEASEAPAPPAPLAGPDPPTGPPQPPNWLEENNDSM